MNKTDVIHILRQYCTVYQNLDNSCDFICMVNHVSCKTNKEFDVSVTDTDIDFTYFFKDDEDYSELNCKVENFSVDFFKEHVLDVM